MRLQTTFEQMVIQTVICQCSFASSKMLFGYKVQTWIVSWPFTSMTATEQHSVRDCEFNTSSLAWQREALQMSFHTHRCTCALTHTHKDTAVMLLVAHFSFWQDARQHTLYRLSVGLAAAVIPWMTQVREFFNFRISPLASILNSVAV